MTSVKRKILRSALAFYISHSPVEKGKGRLLYQMRPWLRAEGETAIARTCFGCDMELDLTDHVQEWIYYFGAYELPLVEFFRSKLASGMVFADIGAQVGQYTLLAAGCVGPSGRVYSFEPAPDTFARLQRNIQLNHFANVQPHNCALADSNGEARLYLRNSGVQEKNVGTNSLRPRAAWNGAREVTVKMFRMDDVDVLRDTARLDAVKIDVEGAELAVLRGGSELLKRFRPLIAIEAEEPNAQAFGYSTRELKAVLEGLGYDLFRILARGRSWALEPTTSKEIEQGCMLVGIPAGK